MNRLSRAKALRIAAILSLLIGLVGFFGALPLLARGATGANLATDSPPYVILLLGFVFAILRMTGAYGVWVKQRWGIVITILANAIDSILALPGIVFAPTLGLWLSATIATLVSIVIIVLCLWRDQKRAAV